MWTFDASILVLRNFLIYPVNLKLKNLKPKFYFNSFNLNFYFSRKMIHEVFSDIMIFILILFKRKLELYLVFHHCQELI